MKYIHYSNSEQIDATQIVGVDKLRSRSKPGYLLRLASGADYLTGPELPPDCVPRAGDYLAFQGSAALLFPKEAFERAFLLAGKMCFSRALQRAKIGERIARAGWDAWVCIADGHPALEAGHFWNQHSRALAASNADGCAPVHAYFIYATNGQIQMGWTPTQLDMLADDWHVV
jgi:hypothetical protein